MKERGSGSEIHAGSLEVRCAGLVLVRDAEEVAADEQDDQVKNRPRKAQLDRKPFIGQRRNGREWQVTENVLVVAVLDDWK